MVKSSQDTGVVPSLTKQPHSHPRWQGFAGILWFSRKVRLDRPETVTVTCDFAFATVSFPAFSKMSPSKHVDMRNPAPYFCMLWCPGWLTLHHSSAVFVLGLCKSVQIATVFLARLVPTRRRPSTCIFCAPASLLQSVWERPVDGVHNGQERWGAPNPFGGSCLARVPRYVTSSGAATC